MIVELLTKWGVAYSFIDRLRPQSDALDDNVRETFRVHASYDEDNDWHAPLYEISKALHTRGLDFAVEFIDMEEFPPIYSCGLEEDFGMTTEEWNSVKEAAVNALTKKRRLWHSMFIMRLGTSSVLSDNPPTLVIATPNRKQIQAIVPWLLQEINSPWIKAVYPSLCIQSWGAVDAKSSYRVDQFDENPKIGLGYSVGVRGSGESSATLGGILDLVYEDGSRRRVGLTNFHLVRDIVKDKRGTLIATVLLLIRPRSSNATCSSQTLFSLIILSDSSAR
jgi:hypothetical protein